MKLYGDQPDNGVHEPKEDRPPEERPEIGVTEIRSADADSSSQSSSAEGPQKKKKSSLAKILTVCGVLVAVILAVVIGYSVWERPPEVYAGSPTPAPAVTVTPKPTQKPQSTDAPEETEVPAETEPPVEEDPGEAPVILSSPMHNSQRKEGVYTVLLLGVDKASDSTDTIMVVSFDTKNHTISATSIPRDTLINIGFISPKKINTVFPYYTRVQGMEEGINSLKQEIRNVLGFEVDNYMVVYLQAVEDVVDAIGGVEYDVPFDMFYEDFVQGLWIEIYAGKQVLDGHNALNFCRFREGYPGGDLQRIEVQHDFLSEMASQVIRKGITNIPGLVKVLLEDVDTDLTAANLAWFARQFLSCSKDDILFQTAPIGGGDLINGVSFVGLDVYGWLDMINASINPYEDDVTLSDVNILTFGYGGFVGSTTGYIAGGYDSFYCLQCTVASGGQTMYHGPNGPHFTFGEPEPEQQPAEQIPEEQQPVEQIPEEQQPVEQMPEEQTAFRQPEEQTPAEEQTVEPWQSEQVPEEQPAEPVYVEVPPPAEELPVVQPVPEGDTVSVEG